MFNQIADQTRASFTDFAGAVHEQANNAIDDPNTRMFWGITAVNTVAGTLLLNQLCNMAPRLWDDVSALFATPPAQADAPREALYELPPASFVEHAGTAYAVGVHPQGQDGAASGTQDNSATPRRSEDRPATMFVAPSERPDLSALTIWRLREPADNPHEASA
ncbi:MAG: hypothetical protein KA795_02045 [Burkholderiaceae bacterium]|nr:hypothetical protein [Burkholderiaceae bacterium]